MARLMFTRTDGRNRQAVARSLARHASRAMTRRLRQLAVCAVPLRRTFRAGQGFGHGRSGVRAAASAHRVGQRVEEAERTLFRRLGQNPACRRVKFRGSCRTTKVPRSPGFGVVTTAMAYRPRPPEGGGPRGCST